MICTSSEIIIKNRKLVENPKAHKLLNKIQRDLMKNGFNAESIISDLKELRPYAIEEKKPVLAKVIRLTCEHIETYQSFHIAIPEDEPVEGFEEEQVWENQVTPEESLDYLLSLMAEPDNKINALELKEYSSALAAYSEDH